MNWRAVDWRRRDIDIARETGYTRERVRQVRRDLGKPDSPDKGSRLKGLIRALGDASMLRGLTKEEIGEVLGVGPGTTDKLVRRFGLTPPKPDRRKHHPEQWNFSLPDKTLAEIWLGSYTKAAAVFVSRMRLHHGKPRARWSRRGGSRDTLRPAYRRAVQAERRRAAAWRRGL